MPFFIFNTTKNGPVIIKLVRIESIFTGNEGLEQGTRRCVIDKRSQIIIKPGITLKFLKKRNKNLESVGPSNVLQ